MGKILITLVLICLSCGDDNNGECNNIIALVNKSDRFIYYGGKSAEPSIGQNPLQSGDYFKIPPQMIYQIPSGRERGCYEQSFEENNNKLYFIIFDEEVLLNNSWGDIVANDMVLKRYSFTLQEMQAANWVITYTDE
jgi:hypothetical protein